MKYCILICLFFLCVPSYSALPPEAQAYLNKIPGRKLTVPVVVEAALRSSDAARMIGYDFASADLEELGVGATTDTNLSLSGTYTDDNSAKTSAFQPNREQRQDYELGIQKNWATGTNTSIGWIQNSYGAEFPPPQGGAPDFSNAFLTHYKQSAAVVNLEQSLLKDSFGYAYRKKREAARNRGAAIQWKTRSDLENLTFNIIGQFYGAWLAQEQVKSIEGQVKRQKRLGKVLKRRARKGVVEKPELIQFEALVTSTEARLDVAKAALANQWEKLVIGLKLPMAFLNIDPMEVPTQIDNPVELSLRLCGHKEPKKTAEISALENQLDGLDADFKAAKNDSLPDLKLVAGYRGNSIDGRASETVANVFGGIDDNGTGRGPAWNVGLKLQMSLDNSAARSNRAQKYIAKEKTAAQLRIAVDDLKSQWRDNCRRLRMESKNEKVFNSTVTQQRKRVSAEEKRFSLGRISVNDLVTAEDDLGTWEFTSQQKSAEVRQLAWWVQKSSGEMYKRLNPLVEQLLKSETP